jgi:uncharacterized membrane protein YkoI
MTVIFHPPFHPKEESMHTLRIGILVLLGAVLAFNGPAWGNEKTTEAAETRKAVELSKTAKVTLDQAIKTASETVTGKVIEAELEEKKGKAVWEIEIVGPDGQVTELLVDADTNTVIGTEKKKF